VAKRHLERSSTDSRFPGSVASSRSPLAGRSAQLAEQGPVSRNGAKGLGMGVYFRDPDGSLLEFISYIA
jgi:catechol 2,3-dioxygenase-like lactoylglutathione lyase family enzyme